MTGENMPGFRDNSLENKRLLIEGIVEKMKKIIAAGAADSDLDELIGKGFAEALKNDPDSGNLIRKGLEDQGYSDIDVLDDKIDEYMKIKDLQ